MTKHPVSWGKTLGCGALACALTFSAPALAESDGIGLILGARGMGEVWQDPQVAQVYRSSRFGGTGFATYGVWRFLSVSAEVGYHRMLGDAVSQGTGGMMEDGTVMELIPLSLCAEATHKLGGVEVFGALGPAATHFSEMAPQQTTSGTKIGAVLMAGARIDTGLYEKSIRPDRQSRLRSVELEVLLGRRQHQIFGVGEGLNLSAWRVGAGLLARF